MRERERGKSWAWGGKQGPHRPWKGTRLDSQSHGNPWRVGFCFCSFLFLVVLGLCYCTRFSVVSVSGGYSAVAVLQLLIAVTSLVGEYTF